MISLRKGKGIFGYEFKWSDKKKEKVPKDWFKSYDNAEFEVISISNYLISCRVSYKTSNSLAPSR